MTEHERGTDRLGRRAKRFLTPPQTYEIWRQLVGGETTIGEAADRCGVDRSTIMRLRTVAKDGALVALAESKPGVGQARRDLEVEAARAAAARLGEAPRGAGRPTAAGGGKPALGLAGRVPPDESASSNPVDMGWMAVRLRSRITERRTHGPVSMSPVGRPR